ncbi:hypothetical protein HBA_0705 [Sodalis endosymbiont of Henestaris halophilus]|nr:hypothetical protein HBA_0705 [Sodalis endosymbiont of Henestaris halophilus]
MFLVSDKVCFLFPGLEKKFTMILGIIAAHRLPGL